jgi:zinc protease
MQVEASMRMCVRGIGSVAAVAMVLLVSSAPLAAAREAALPPGISKVRSIEGVDEYRLSNGLQVLLYPDPTKPTATVNVTYKVGSRMENYGETGMAHLLEHLMF